MNYEDFIRQAEIHYKAHDYAQVIVCATQAIDLPDTNTKVDGYYWRGAAYERTYAQEEIIEKDIDALLASPHSTALHSAYRGWAYGFKKEYDLAVAECSKALELDPVIEAYLYRALAYQNLGKSDLSIDDCNEAIVIDPKCAFAYDILGTIYHKKGEYDRAIKNYEKAIEQDPKYATPYNNRVNAYHAKDDSLEMKLVSIRKNQQHMRELKKKIKKVIPFFGAGASKPYGYYTWRELLQELFSMCRRCDEIDDEIEKQIQLYIDDELYLDAASEMDKIFPNIGSAVCTVIRRVAEANPIETVEMHSILSEYLHLFPRKIYLTTNYDTVIEDILKTKCQRVGVFYPTSGLIPQQEQENRKEMFDWRKLSEGWLKFRTPPKYEDTIRKIYYLHGEFNNPISITLSRLHYDDYYGADGDMKSNLRRYLPKQLYDIYHDAVFLYIGCGMNIRQDRILKVLKEFFRNLPGSSSSYALININEVTKSEEAYENWGNLDENKKKEFSRLLDEKEDELENMMNVRVIWYSAPMKNSNDGHESAKRQLFSYILGKEKRDSKQEEITEKQEEVKARQEEIKVKQKERDAAEKLFEEFESESYEKEKGDSKSIKNDINGIVLSEEQLKQVNVLFHTDIKTKEAFPGKYEIIYPIYKINGGLYEISLMSENGEFYLSDEGTTYRELDEIFELKEPDVIKNLVAILKQYGCRKQRNTNAFIVHCTLEDIHIKMSYLIQAISFMLNMKIFYV